MKPVIIVIGSQSGLGFGWSLDIENDADLCKQVASRIEQFRPINSTDEGAEAYRQRFRNQPIFYKEKYSKEEFKQAEGGANV